MTLRRRGIGLEDAADHDAISKHVEIVVIPLAGRARSRCTLEDEVVAGAKNPVPVPKSLAR
jgi:hypothetical protein